MGKESLKGEKIGSEKKSWKLCIGKVFFFKECYEIWEASFCNKKTNKLGIHVFKRVKNIINNSQNKNSAQI